MSLLRYLLVDPSSIGAGKEADILTILHRSFEPPPALKMVLVHATVTAPVTDSMIIIAHAKD